MKPNLKIAYNDMANLYDSKSQHSLYNTCYERPIVISLLPNLSNNKLVVDVGCGSGILSQ